MDSKNRHDGIRQIPTPLEPRGKGWDRALKSRSQAILNTLLGYLASNYTTSIPSTSYGNHLKAVATELAKLTLTLEDQLEDISFGGVRSEFLYQVIAYMLFIGQDLPDLGPGSSDDDFKEFLLQIIRLFFQGSIPQSIREAVSLFSSGSLHEVLETFKDIDPIDISRQFEFVIDLEGIPSDDFFRIQQNVETLVRIIKPAHTLFSVRHIFHDIFDPEEGDGPPKLSDGSFWDLKDFRYDDVRKFCKGRSYISSETGRVKTGDLGVLWDEEEPLIKKVHRGNTLIIEEGPNRGRYIVLEVLNKEGDPFAEGGVRVNPRLRQVEAGVRYKVEIDRSGRRKVGKPFTEDVSSQFI